MRRRGGGRGVRNERLNKSKREGSRNEKSSTDRVKERKKVHEETRKGKMRED